MVHSNRASSTAVIVYQGDSKFRSSRRITTWQTNSKFVAVSGTSLGHDQPRDCGRHDGECEGEQAAAPEASKRACPVAPVVLALADVCVVLLEHCLVAIVLVLLPPALADDANVATHWRKQETFVRVIFTLPPPSLRYIWERFSCLWPSTQPLLHCPTSYIQYGGNVPPPFRPWFSHRSNDPVSLVCVLAIRVFCQLHRAQGGPRGPPGMRHEDKNLLHGGSDKTDGVSMAGELVSCPGTSAATARHGVSVAGELVSCSGTSAATARHGVSVAGELVSCSGTSASTAFWSTCGQGSQPITARQRK